MRKIISQFIAIAGLALIAFQSQAAIPTLTSSTFTSSGGSDQTSTNVSYPASGINSGDLLVCIWVNDGAGDLPTWPTGDWADNVLYSENNSHGSSVSYIIAAGTENGGTFNVTHASQATEAFLLHFQNWHGTTPPEVGARAFANSDAWNATSITPSGWDSSVDDTLWIGLMTTDQLSRTISSWPSEIPDNRTSTGGGTIPNIFYATDDTSGASKSIALLNGSLSSSLNHRVAILGIRGAAAGGGLTHIRMLNQPSAGEGPHKSQQLGGVLENE
ncbi:MAG: hypothetical protein J3T61_12110 [Candidatus Brocadiales bacterium]|nr:hypothetical protein [Candidatus Bathyanammoxibius sp.]